MIAPFSAVRLPVVKAALLEVSLDSEAGVEELTAGVAAVWELVVRWEVALVLRLALPAAFGL